MVSFINDYDDLTVEEVKTWVETTSVSADDLLALIDYEASNKNRSTLLEFVERRMEGLEADIGPSEADVPPAGVDSNLMRVRVLRQYCCGEWFDNTGVVAEFPDGPRLHRAIQNGEAEHIPTSSEE